jgi:hypothetical protein
MPPFIRLYITYWFIIYWYTFHWLHWLADAIIGCAISLLITIIVFIDIDTLITYNISLLINYIIID